MLMVVFATNSFSQGDFKFEEEAHDFGLLIEGVNPEYVFTFLNTGDEPIEMSNVKPSCGCTTPFWTKEPIMPGETGTIKVSYNTNNRVGQFKKSITITSNAKEGSKMIIIKGVVEAKRIDSTLTQKQKLESPKLIVEKNEFHLGKLEQNKSVIKRLTIKNEGLQPLVISDVKAGCRCVTYSLDKTEIGAGSSTDLILTYVPRDLGVMNDKVVLVSNDLNNAYTVISLNSEVVESFNDSNMLMNAKPMGF